MSCIIICKYVGCFVIDGDNFVGMIFFFIFFKVVIVGYVNLWNGKDCCLCL